MAKGGDDGRVQEEAAEEGNFSPWMLVTRPKRERKANTDNQKKDHVVNVTNHATHAAPETQDVNLATNGLTSDQVDPMHVVATDTEIGKGDNALGFLGKKEQLQVFKIKKLFNNRAT